MNTVDVAAVAMMVLGGLAMLRSVLVVVRSDHRHPLEPWLLITLGAALALAGQALLPVR